MRTWKKLVVTFACATLYMAGGCMVSVQPWTKHPPSPAADPASANQAAGFKGPSPNPYPAYPPNGLSPAGYPPSAYSPHSYPQNMGASNESTAQLIKQLNETDDQRKALQEQLQTLRKQVRDREDNLQHASYEMEESTKQLKRTREEVRQFSGELDDLRERMRKLEEMRSSLKPLIDEIMFHLEREKETGKAPRAPTSK